MISEGLIPISIEATVFAKKDPFLSIIFARLIIFVVANFLLIFISDFQSPNEINE